MSTALEIVSNPDDLWLKLSEDNILIISRGPGHKFKTLLSGSLKDLEDPFEFIESLLKGFIEHTEKELQDKESVFHSFLNPTSKPMDELDTLKGSDVDKIIDDLKESGETATFKWWNEK